VLGNLEKKKNSFLSSHSSLSFQPEGPAGLASPLSNLIKPSRPSSFSPLFAILGRSTKLVSRAQLPSPLSSLTNGWCPLHTHCHAGPARQRLPPPFRVRLGLCPSQITHAISDFPGFGCACHALALYKSASSLPTFFSPESQVEALA
jgi:hypothetical protein